MGSIHYLNTSGAPMTDDDRKRDAIDSLAHTAAANLERMIALGAQGEVAEQLVIIGRSLSPEWRRCVSRDIGHMGGFRDDE